MPALFHIAPILLGPGSIVLPGNYGRLITHYGDRHRNWSRESALEAVRALKYPDKPSRLRSCFAFSDVETARYYRSVPQLGGVTGAIYEVEKVNMDAAEHRADFNVVQPLPGYPETMEQIAHLYWTAGLWVSIVEAPGVRCEEVLTISPLRILGRVD